MVWKDTTRIERIEFKEEKIDTSIFHKKSSAHSFQGFLIGKIKEARNQGNKELVFLLYELYKKYQEFQKSELFTPLKWKGKSGVKYIEFPDKVISIRYQKPEPFEEPKEIRLEITREEINRVIWALQGLNLGTWLETSEVAERVYNKGWKQVFSDRPKHIKLCEIFNYLESKRIIDYSRSGKVLLKNS